MSSIRKTARLAKVYIFQKKLIFINFEKIKLSPKIGNLRTLDTEMMNIMFNKTLY
jgi:hypothetical protein